MQRVFSVIVVVLLALMMVTTEAGKNKKERGKSPKGTSDCTEWRYGNCVPNNGDCGVGVREGTCNDQTKKLKCKVPCNWKKEFGADCKYKFGSWGECDTTTGTKNRSGTLKKALYNAECQTTIKVSKPCPQRPRQRPKERRGKGRRIEESLNVAMELASPPEYSTSTISPSLPNISDYTQGVTSASKLKDIIKGKNRSLICY